MEKKASPSLILLFQNTIKYSWYLVVFLFSLNFQGNTTLNTLVLICLGLLYAIVRNGKIIIRTDFVLLSLFCVIYYSYLVAQGSSNVSTFVNFLVAPIFTFIIGQSTTSNSSLESYQRDLHNTIMLIAIVVMIRKFFNN